jgi:hypothetical protein
MNMSRLVPFGAAKSFVLHLPHSSFMLCLWSASLIRFLVIVCFSIFVCCGSLTSPDALVCNSIRLMLAWLCCFRGLVGPSNWEV